MKKITKSLEPKNISDWKRRNPTGTYSDLSQAERDSIKIQCTKDQMFLCAYCCQSISGNSKDTINEHIKPRKHFPNLDLDFNNIVASCNTKNQCDHSHQSRKFDLTPLMEECEKELIFKISGRVEGLSTRAKQTISVLNLGDHERNNRSIIEKRKQLVSNLLFANGINPTEGLEDDDLLEMVIDELLTPEDGKLDAFSPVVANILKSWISRQP